MRKGERKRINNYSQASGSSLRWMVVPFIEIRKNREWFPSKYGGKKITSSFLAV
jgi:hypothetical protein